MKTFGPIMLVEGPKNSSKLPYSRSLYIGGKAKVLIDSGAAPAALQTIEKEQGIRLIANTHYHPDHTSNNHLFPDVEKWMNPLEFKTALTFEGAAKLNGIYQEWGEEGVRAFRRMVTPEMEENLSGITHSYEYGREYLFGDVKTVFLHMPGHTAGYTCPYFPDYGVVHAGDFDMTSFGPWYNGTDGDIGKFVDSAKQLLELDADTYVTSHQKGVFTKAEFKAAMSGYLAVIEKRDEIIYQLAQDGRSFDSLTSFGVFYPKRVLAQPMLKTWERSGIRKHLERLGIMVKEESSALPKAN